MSLPPGWTLPLGVNLSQGWMFYFFGKFAQYILGYLCPFRKYCPKWAIVQLSKNSANLVTLRPIHNFAHRSKLWPQGPSCPQGWILSPGGEILCSPLHSSKQQRVFNCGGWTKGWTFPLGDKFHFWGPGVKLRMALCSALPHLLSHCRNLSANLLHSSATKLLTEVFL
jgi:hypothetical protein